MERREFDCLNDGKIRIREDEIAGVKIFTHDTDLYRRTAIVRMIPKPLSALTAKDEALFGDVVTAAFSQRRKMLRNTLREFISEEALSALGIAPTARAETLSVSDYINITNALAA